MRGSNPRPPEESGGQSGSERQECGQHVNSEKRCEDKDGGEGRKIDEERDTGKQPA